MEILFQFTASMCRAGRRWPACWAAARCVFLAHALAFDAAVVSIFLRLERGLGLGHWISGQLLQFHSERIAFGNQLPVRKACGRDQADGQAAPARAAGAAMRWV